MTPTLHEQANAVKAAAAQLGVAADTVRREVILDVATRLDEARADVGILLGERADVTRVFVVIDDLVRIRHD